jgi:RimJ/RimL family protein N-acetyltransferase
MSEKLAQSVIGTKRLVLRRLRDGDAPALFALFNDWEVMRFLSSPPWPYRLEDAEAYIRMQRDPQPEEISFAITLENKLIGSIGVRAKEASHLQAGAGPCIGYWLGQPYWGYGFMTESLRALVTHVFTLTGDDTIYSGAFADNLASLRVQTKVGFAHAGNTTLFSRPTGHELAHVNTALTRASFERLAA